MLWLLLQQQTLLLKQGFKLTFPLVALALLAYLFGHIHLPALMILERTLRQFGCIFWQHGTLSYFLISSYHKKEYHISFIIRMAQEREKIGTKSEMLSMSIKPKCTWNVLCSSRKTAKKKLKKELNEEHKNCLTFWYASPKNKNRMS